MNNPTENDRRSRSASRKAGSHLYVGCSSVVGFVAAWIIMCGVIDLLLPPSAGPQIRFFMRLFVAAAAGFLFGRRAWRRTKSDRGFSPPQFTLHALFAVVTALAVLLGQLQWFAPAPWQWGALVVFFGIVWVAQRFLFGGRRPWFASVLVGATLGVLLWLFAWGMAKSYVARSGGQVGAADLVRDLFLAVASGVALAIAATLLLAWSFSVVAFVGLVLSWRPPRAKRRSIPSDSPPETTDQRPAEMDGSAEGELRCGHRGVLRCPAILSAAAGVLLFIAALLLHKPIRIGYHRFAVAYCTARDREKKAPSPVEAMQSWSEIGFYSLDLRPYSRWSGASRAKLVELGYLARRDFIFHHIPTGVPETRYALLMRLFAHDSEGSYWTFHRPGDLPDKPLRYWLRVWDRPAKMPEWEAFVREVDRPDFPENVTP